MEQHKNILNNNKEENKSNMKSIEGDEYNMGVPVHLQVIKIKQEIEKIMHPSLQEPEMRRVLLRGFTRQRSPSPLGLAKRPISV
ncbi:hypothetical protein RGQ29_014746 [Quercus rubra]|uniref:Uncharacterized protein n=1 Tax=Quercus rubra TaxID=3512 RepID=A0AAN7FQ34_QUERU|nr:hypothetical protein RGQ29_014746 [Quercus rubra]